MCLFSYLGQLADRPASCTTCSGNRMMHGCCSADPVTATVYHTSGPSRPPRRTGIRPGSRFVLHRTGWAPDLRTRVNPRRVRRQVAVHETEGEAALREKASKRSFRTFLFAGMHTTSPPPPAHPRPGPRCLLLASPAPAQGRHAYRRTQPGPHNPPPLRIAQKDRSPSALALRTCESQGVSGFRCTPTPRRAPSARTA